MKPTQAFKMGMFQAIATLPGVSRSGVTIAAGVNMGFDRNTMLEFSFMMSLPAVIGAVVLNLGELSNGFSVNAAPYLVGTLTAAVTGILSIKLLQFAAKKERFGWFMLYCILAGIAAIVVDVAVIR